MKKLRGNMNRKSLAWNLAGSVLVIIMVFLAVESPNWIQTYMDGNAEKRVDGFELEVQTYDQENTSFAEEMKLLANESSWEGVQLVPVTDNEEQITSEQLTNAVNLELNHMFEQPDLVEKLAVSPEQLTARERYSLYSPDAANKLNGLEIWKLEYAADEQTVKIVLDVNFQKMYMFHNEKNNSNIFDNIDLELNAYLMNRVQEYYDTLKEEGEDTPEVMCLPLKQFVSASPSVENYAIDKATDADVVDDVDGSNKSGLGTKGVGAMGLGFAEDSTLLLYYDYNIQRKDDIEIQCGIYHFRQMLQL